MKSMEPNIESHYQKMANLITNMIPEPWIEIKLYVNENSEGARTRFFYYKSTETHEWIYNMDIPENFQFPEEEFDKLDDKLYICVSNFKNAYKLEYGEEWKSFQLNLYSNGKFKVHFNYGKNPFGPGKTQTIWEYEHLGLSPEAGSVDRELLDEYLEEKSHGKRYPFLEPEMGQQ